MAARLISLYGWHLTYLLFGVSSTLVPLLAAALTQKPPRFAVTTQKNTGKALRTTTFAILWASSFLCSVSVVVQFVFLSAFTRTLGISVVAGAALISFFGFASVCGRLSIGALADRRGVIRPYPLCFLLQAVSYAIWLGAHSYASLPIFALVLGAGYGG